MKTLSSSKQFIALTGSIAMLAVALLLPLVNVKSYSWGLFELPHKIQRLIHDDVQVIIAFVLLALLVIVPVVVALVAWLKDRVPRTLALLPFIVGLAFTIILFIGHRTSPGLGLYIYDAVALATLIASFKSN